MLDVTPDAQPESKFLTLNGLRLHYLDWGHPEAPAIVCLHGFAMSAQAFNGFARRFRGRFRVIAADLRGHGDSAWAPGGAYQYEDHLADLEGTVDALGLGRFTLVGSSLGGRAAIMYAGAHPERVERLVLNDVGPDTRTDYSRRPADAVPRPRTVAAPEEALPYLRWSTPVFNRLNEEEQVEQARALLRRGPDGMWTWKMDQEPIRQRRALGSPPPTPDLWPILARLTCPALLVWGMASHMLDAAQARRVVDTLQNGRLVAVPGSGHTPWLTEPEAVAALEEFLVGPE